MSYKKCSLQIMYVILFIAFLVISLNVYINPYGFYGSNQRGFTTLNARDVKYYNIKTITVKPDVFVFGSSNSMRFLPETIKQKTHLKSYNYAIFYATAEDYFCLPRSLYEIKGVNPKLIIFCLDVFSFSNTPQSYDEVFRGAKNRLSYKEQFSKYLSDFSKLKLFWFRLKSALTFKQTLESLTTVFNRDVTSLSQQEMFNHGFKEGGVRKKYADFEGNDVTQIAEKGEYLIEEYIKRKDKEFKRARNGYKGIVSVKANYDFNGLSTRRLSLFEESIKHLNNKNCKVVFNIMPVQPYFNKLLYSRTNHKDNVVELLLFCKSLEKKYSNVILTKDNSQITNFNGLAEHFFDSYHPTSVNSDLMIESLNLEKIIY